MLCVTFRFHGHFYSQSVHVSADGARCSVVSYVRIPLIIPSHHHPFLGPCVGSYNVYIRDAFALSHGLRDYKAAYHILLLSFH